MFVTRVTRSFIKPGVLPGERQNRLRQHGTLFIFFTKMLHFVQHFCEKAWNLPPCRRRIGPFDQADACLVNDRVSRVCEYYPGIMGETTRNTRHYYDNEIFLTVETQRAQR
jgi:hypothetical protein